MPKNAATWSSPRWRSSGTRRRVRRTVQSGLPLGAGAPTATHSAARKRQSKRALCATNTAASSARPTPAATSLKRGRPATMPSVIPVRRATHGGIAVPGSSNASKARWMVPPSRIATATSRIRPPCRARTPVVSTSTTAKRECSRDWDGGLEVIPPQRQGHASGTAAAADHRLEWVVHRLHGGEEVGHLLYPFRFLAAVQHGEPLRPHEVRRIDATQVAVELREDHVQVD